MSAKKTKKIARRRRSDGWLNVFTGLGLANRDKRMGGQQWHDILDYQDLVELYRGSDLAARIVDTIPEEMTREGFDVLVQQEEEGERGEPSDGTRPVEPADYRNDSRRTRRFRFRRKDAQSDPKEESEHIMATCDEFDVLGVFKDVMCKERAFGGGAIFVGADDGERDLRRPLREDAIKQIRFLTTFDARELIGVRWYNDPFDSKYGLPKIYRVQPQTVLSANSSALRKNGPFPEIHESRLIRFGGIHVSRRTQRENYGWGDATLIRCNQIITDYSLSWDGIAHMLQDGWQGVFKMKGLHDLIMNGDDATVLARMQQVDLQRSIARMMVIDAEGDEFERHSLTLAGLPDTMQQMALRLAAAANMPVMLLLGQPPSGLNATGKGDMQWWYDKVASMQRTTMRPGLNRLLKLLFLSKRGPTNGQEPSNWTIKFNPLQRLSETEQAEVRLKQAQTDHIYVTDGVVSPEEIAESRFGGDGYSTETIIDLEARDGMKDARQQAIEAELKKRTEVAQQPLEANGEPGAGSATSANQPDGSLTSERNGK